MSKNKILYLTELAILAAVILLMSFTPIGYFRMPGIEITFITIPVVVGAIVMGPAAGGILGGIFGLSSFIQCFGMSAFGAALLAINPVFTLILCLIPRILVGLLTGFVFRGFRKKTIPAFLTASLGGAVLNTLLFVGGLVLLFGRSEFVTGLVTDMGGGNILAFFVAFVGLNGLIEAVACGVLGTAVSRAVYSLNTKKLL